MNWYLHACRHLQTHPFIKWYTNSILLSLGIWLAHYLSAFLTVGSMVMIDLRILGFAGKQQTMTEVADFYSPWMWIGLSVLSLSGTLMLTGDSAVYCTNGIFGVNLLVTALAAVTGVIIRKKVPAWDRPSGAPLSAKIVAGVALLLWLATILSAVEVPAISDVSYLLHSGLSCFVAA
jgi:hypothetical protein